MGLLALQRYHTGVLQKQDPLPIGRYWIDVYGDSHVMLINKWLYDNNDTVKLENTEGYSSTDAAPEGGGFVLFSVGFPTAWGMSKDLGWPTVATPDIHSSKDTVQRPPEQSATDYWFGEGGKATWVPWAIGGTVIVVGLVAVAKLVRG